MFTRTHGYCTTVVCTVYTLTRTRSSTVLHCPVDGATTWTHLRRERPILSSRRIYL